MAVLSYEQLMCVRTSAPLPAQAGMATRVCVASARVHMRPGWLLLTLDQVGVDRPGLQGLVTREDAVPVLRLGRQIHVIEHEWKPDRVEAKQLILVHNHCEVSGCLSATSPQTVDHGSLVVEAEPTDTLDRHGLAGLGVQDFAILDDQRVGGHAGDRRDCSARTVKSEVQ